MDSFMWYIGACDILTAIVMSLGCIVVLISILKYLLERTKKENNFIDDEDW